jgi:cytochrome P450 family 6
MEGFEGETVADFHFGKAQGKGEASDKKAFRTSVDICFQGMFETIINCGQVLENYLDTNVKQGVDVFEFRDLMARWNTNIISSVAFGIETDCINDREHIFRKMGAKNFENTWRMALGMFLAFFMPKAIKVLKFKLMEPEVEEFIINIVKQTVEYREANNVERNDFMQMLIQLKNQGYVSVDKDENVEREVKKLNFIEMAAQVFVFFIAGWLRFLWFA